MNFVESCRKGAGWPSLHRDVPLKTDGQKIWGMSQETLASFVGQVRSRSDDLISELRSRDDRISRMSEEKAQISADLAAAEITLAKYEIAKKVKMASESLGLEADQCKRLESAAA